ncbi:MAG: hypothetical protein U9R56_01185 [candidate division Zixibacteria bacterium]|nr:hypothetical protein [candidate division Zixibacteria bacterium]
MEHVALWLGAFLTLGIMSFLYKDNPWYKICESIFIGISSGYWFVYLFWVNFYGKFWMGVFPPEEVSEAGQVITREPDYMLCIGAGLGLLMLLRLIPKVGWMSRWPLAFIVGATSGLWMMNYFASNIMRQVEGTILPLFSLGFGSGFDADYATIIGNLVIVVGTFTGLVYFFFSKEHKGAFGRTARIGIFFIMITFGASFGYTVMSRMSLLIGRIDFLLGDWLGMIQ